MSQPLVSSTRTWLTEPLVITDDTIYVESISNITNTIVQSATAPVAVAGVMRIGLDADKNSIVNIVVYNNTTSAVISSSHYTIVIENTAPVLKITTGSWIATGNSLTITTIDGNFIYINGEQIKFGSVNTTTNTLNNLSRGQNGTAAQDLIPKYTEVWGLLLQNKMNNVGYVHTWNSYNYNATLGDPLQISTTSEALFLTNNKYIVPFPIISPFPQTTTTTTTVSPPFTTTTTSTTSTTSTSTSTTSTSTSTTSTSTSTTSTTTSGPTTTTTSTTSTTTAAPTTTTTTTAAPTTTTSTTTSTSTSTSTSTTTVGGGPVSPLGFNDGNYIFIKSTPGVASLTLRLFDNGIWQIIPANTGSAPAVSGDLTSWSLITGNWYAPTTTSIGSNYLYQVDTVDIIVNGAGTVTPDFTGPGAWLPFTGDIVTSVAITAGAGDEAIGSFTVTIAVNNSGSPGTIVSTTTFIMNGSRGA
jgi:hypothetical protein